MLRHQRSLFLGFSASIVAAFVIFLVFPLFVKASWCEPSWKNQWGIYGDSRVEQNQYAANNNSYITVPTVAYQQYANNENDNSKTNYSKYLSRTGLCEDTKFTDWALVFFTSCLVIVGGFGIVSSERSTFNLERPYIFGTPQIDEEQTSDEGNIFVKVMIHNYGRTPGTVEIVYGEASITEPVGVPVYEKGGARTAAGMLAPTLGKPTRAPVTFECPRHDGLYFFGYVRYVDLFNQSHTSRFCAQIFLDLRGIEPAGSEAWSDWN